MVLIYLGYRVWRRKSWNRYAENSALSRLRERYSRQKEILRDGFTFIAFTLLILAICNPQWGYRKEKVNKASSDIYIALDISNSMLAEDIAPSRLERAKRFASQLSQELRAERQGLILFAGNAYLQTPLTTDYAAIQMFLRSAHPGQAATQGTEIGAAIDLVLKAHQEDSDHQVAMIIITDGENHDENALNAMQRGRDGGIIPIVVAVGTEEGGFIPVRERGREEYKRDKQGNPVKTQLNTEFLRQLAQTGGGDLLALSSGEEIMPYIKNRIDEFEKIEMEARSFTDFESYFQEFILVAFMLLVIGQLIGELKTRKKVHVEA